MIIQSPHGYQYPIRVKSLVIDRSKSFKRGDNLLSYSYQTYRVEDNDLGEEQRVLRTVYNDMPSESDGKLTRWLVQAGDEISGPGVAIAEIEEDCRHEVQFGGMCVNCGRDMETVDFMTTRKNTERANISMFAQPSLKVSKAEAEKSTEEGMRRLLKARKLTLVVDLDQTIIHTTCDPTVPEWRADVTNPNHEAVKDVRSFELHDHGPDQKPCAYHVKMRPGLAAFMEKVSEMYEMHIYTMATRSYAEHVARIVDPDRKYFGQRILSRDESGSLERKSLERLFPVDTKMVVIIDDRADIWNYSHNLVRVRVYNFYVGTGDINSSFLPKQPDLVTVPTNPVPGAPTVSVMTDAEPKPEPGSDVAATEAAEAPPGALSIEDAMVRMAENTQQASVEEQAQQQQAEIDAQVQDRPLLRMQAALEKEEATIQRRRTSSISGSTSSESDVDGDAASTPRLEIASPDIAPVSTLATTPEQQVMSPEVSVTAPQDQPMPDADPNTQMTMESQRIALLHDDDDELDYLAEHLASVHDSFYKTYDTMLEDYQARGAKPAVAPSGRKLPKSASSTANTSMLPLSDVPDVGILLPTLKSTVLDGTTLCITGLIPLGRPHETSDLGFWARSFGANVDPKLIPGKTTHVVAERERKTGKVRQAARLRVTGGKGSDIEIVDRMWLMDCFSKWEWLPEDVYRIEVEPENRLRVEKRLEVEGVSPRGFGEEFTDVTDGETGDEANANGAARNNGAGQAPRKSKLSINTTNEVEEENEEMSGLMQSPTMEDWDDIDKELDEFLASESDEEEYDEDEDDDEDMDEDEDLDDDENPDTEEDGTPRKKSKKSNEDETSPVKTRKRKRSRASSKTSTSGEASSTSNKKSKPVDDGNESTDPESDTDQAAPKLLGSELQRRKRMALGRTSSLSNVVTLDAAIAKSNGKGKGRIEVEEEEEDEDDDGLEAALEAAFEDEDDEE
jgi:RNA polymerase II subunit A-like phosphatase